MRVVKREAPEKPSDEYIKRLVQEYKNSKSFMDKEEKRLGQMKKELSEYVDSNGVVDHNGHRWLTIDDVEIKRERRVSRSFNSAAARQWAEENGYWDKVCDTIVVLSEDKILALAWDNKDLAPIVQSFYEEKENWAFKA
jgi:hypothetical protein